MYNNYNTNESDTTYTVYNEFNGFTPVDPVQFTMLTEDNQTVNAISTERTNFDQNLANLNPPFPPNIDPKVLALELFNKGGKRTKKMLNEFFLFRKEFVKELKRLNLRPRQTKVSSLASMSWHKQKSSVKDEYRRLAREVEKLFMLERQREANEASRAESNESSTDDPASPQTVIATDPINMQLPLSPLSLTNDVNVIERNSTYNIPYQHQHVYHQQEPEFLPWSYSRHESVTPYINYQYLFIPSHNSQVNDYFTSD